MFQQVRNLIDYLPERFRGELGQRSTGFIVALALEALLLLLLFTLGQSDDRGEELGPVLTTFDASSSSEQEAEQAAEEPVEEEPQPAAETAPQPREPEPQEPEQAQPRPAPSRPALIPVPKDRMDALDISKAPSREPAKPAPNRPMMGPANTNSRPDTPRVGTAPNGEPLYAAEWYREPTDQELAGYLSTAQGPGWGLIACKTVPDFRVEDCVALDEYPANSQMARAVLAAAWQFRVRPPRRGGRSLVGEWVRIRIDYQIRRETYR